MPVELNRLVAVPDPELAPVNTVPSLIQEWLPDDDVGPANVRVVDEFPETTTVTPEKVVGFSTVLLLELARDEIVSDKLLVAESLASGVADSGTLKVVVEFPETKIVTPGGLEMDLLEALLLKLDGKAMREADMVVELSEVLLLKFKGNALDEEEASGSNTVPAMLWDDIVDPETEVELAVAFSLIEVELEVVCGKALVQSLHVKRAMAEVGGGDHAGPVLWHGAPYSQQANVVFVEFNVDEVDSGSLTVVVVSMQVVVFANCRAK